MYYVVLSLLIRGLNAKNTGLFIQHPRKIKNLSFVICFFRSGFQRLPCHHHPVFHHKYPLCGFCCFFFPVFPLPPMVRSRSTNRFLSYTHYRSTGHCVSGRRRCPGSDVSCSGQSSLNLIRSRCLLLHKNRTLSLLHPVFPSIVSVSPLPSVLFSFLSLPAKATYHILSVG